MVVTRSAGVAPRMSQNADNTCNDSRSGVPETRRWTWEADRSTPRSRSSGTSSVSRMIARPPAGNEARVAATL
jgi:hypothetical protein